MNAPKHAPHDSPTVVVIGGANVDVQGRSSSALVAGESHPGRVTTSPGGVGRNVAHWLSVLGVETTLIAALGQDDHGRWLAATTADAGVDVSHVIWSSQPTAIYVAVLDADGELALAVNDMAAMGDLDASAVGDRSAVIDRADAVVVDCNLDEATLAAIASRGRPLFVDTVSAAKASHIVGVLGRVHTIKPNRAELAALTALDVSTDAAVEAAARTLVERGVTRVVVSLGAEGVLVVDRETATAMGPSRPDASASADQLRREVASVTGAGDALLAGLVAAHVRGDDTPAAIRAALDAAAAARASPGAVTG